MEYSEQEYLQAMDQAENRRIRQEETIRSLQHQLKHEKQQVASVKQLADQIHMEKDSSMVMFAPQPMDSNVCEDFSSLLDDIRTWSTKFSCDTGRMSDFKSDNTSNYHQVVPLCNDAAGIVSFMDQYRNDQSLDEKSRKQLDKMRKRHFVRGRASFVMIERCFQSSDIWLRTAYLEAVHRIERVLSETD
ncbi:hypothetical protein P171DRAFT_429929 [Karstenula rhodostoma CBS 690.94]|uniref:Uncharacterized protein n=1 Tax=Karstenula rhodostoma CBS 690.94 TaxID=1392251 RepID=A0A9P4UE29_9PLEO|nr:hypothetical protein P171DRAFT_429929 [Karstenula rhodostoma CBS 690.94]